MGEFNHRVERQRLLLEAEEWAKGFMSMHTHSLNSMWYDTRPQDTEDGKMVTDIQYNNGLIERRLSDGTKVYFGKELKGDDLIDQYQKYTGNCVING
tara:strand:+ start:893 stop:1183 length:291 start_codon:yes stop_codon:yes gene_type:complete